MSCVNQHNSVIFSNTVLPQARPNVDSCLSDVIMYLISAVICLQTHKSEAFRLSLVFVQF